MTTETPLVLSDKVLDIKNEMNSHVALFQVLANRISMVAAEPSTLSGSEMTQLVAANNKAGAALNVLSFIHSVGADEKQLLTNLEILFHTMIRDRHVNEASSAVYAAILSLRRND